MDTSFDLNTIRENIARKEDLCYFSAITDSLFHVHRDLMYNPEPQKNENVSEIKMMKK